MSGFKFSFLNGWKSRTVFCACISGLSLMASLSTASAQSYLSLCNQTGFGVNAAFLYDQSADRSEFRQNNDTYLAAAWLPLEVGECIDGLTLASGQWAYFGFRGFNRDGGSDLSLSVEGYPISGRSTVRTICVPVEGGGIETSNSISDLSVNCRAGFRRLEVSFGVRGGRSAIRGNIVSAP